MMGLHSRKSSAWILVLGNTSFPACGEASDSGAAPPSGSCPEGHRAFGECVGVVAQAVCEAEVCTDAVACGKVVIVHNDAELAAALANPSPGTCIALTAGSYGDAVAPA